MRFSILATSLAFFCSCSSETDVGSAGAGSAVAPVEITTASGVAMVVLPGGVFSMGNAAGDPDEKPEHTVRVSGFAIDQFEVTHDLVAAGELTM